jgi:hypothetical protein
MNRISSHVPQRGNKRRIVNKRFFANFANFALIVSVVSQRARFFANFATFALIFSVVSRRANRQRIVNKRFFANFANFALILFVVSVGSGSAQTPSQLPTAIPQTKFASGQNVVPYFEGWIKNADGSFDLVFGYFNRNWEQSLVIQSARTTASKSTIRKAREPPLRIWATRIAASRRSSCRDGKAGCTRASAGEFRQAGDALDDQVEQQDRDCLRGIAAGRGDYRADHHDAR